MTSLPSSSDHQRFAEWIRQHGHVVRGYLRAMVRSDEAEDLLQEVFRRAWQARERYCEQGSPRAYLLRIADRLIIDRHRGRHPEVNLNTDQWRVVEPSLDADPAQMFTRTEARAELAAALEQLTPLQRRVLLLRFFGELTFAEIAAAIDCPLNTTLSHCRRGLLAMRKLLAEKTPDS